MKLDTAGVGMATTTTIVETFYRDNCFEKHTKTHPCQKSYTDPDSFWNIVMGEAHANHLKPQTYVNYFRNCILNVIISQLIKEPILEKNVEINN